MQTRSFTMDNPDQLRDALYVACMLMCNGDRKDAMQMQRDLYDHGHKLARLKNDDENAENNVVSISRS